MKKILSLLILVTCISFSSIGRAADISSLIKDLGTKRKGGNASDELARIGTPAIPQLIEALKDKDRHRRRYAARALREMGQKASAAIPALTESLNDSDENTREYIVEALGNMFLELDAVAPFLKKATQDKNENVRKAAVAAVNKLASYPISTSHVERRVKERLNKAGNKKCISVDLARTSSNNYKGTAELVGGERIGLAVFVNGLELRYSFKPIVARLSNETVANPTQVLSNSIGMKLVRIPSGQFNMGSENSALDERPLHRVKISKDFWISQTEVTQDQYRAIMKSEPWLGKQGVQSAGDNPAVYVSWKDAWDFCKMLGQKEGFIYRPPTEAEWEYACRSGTRTPYSFGESQSSLLEYAWFDENAYGIGEKYAHRVAQKKPNAFGLYDMHGNVSEWCNDWYAHDYYSMPSAAIDPLGAGMGEYRVLRGGCWFSDSSHCYSTTRAHAVPLLRKPYYGFRVVRELTRLAKRLPSKQSETAPEINSRRKARKSPDVESEKLIEILAQIAVEANYKQGADFATMLGLPSFFYDAESMEEFYRIIPQEPGVPKVVSLEEETLRELLRMPTTALKQRMFGISLGESLDTVRKRTEITKISKKEDDMLEAWLVHSNPETVSKCKIGTFAEKVQYIAVDIKDASETNREAIRQQLENKYAIEYKYGENLGRDQVFLTTITGTPVVIFLELSRVIGERRLSIVYIHCPLVVKCRDEIRRQAAERIGKDL